MKTKTTLENNILLAEFLDMLTTDSEGNIKEDVNSFKFHNDWNWLMMVVDKIETVEPRGQSGSFTVTIHHKTTEINQYGMINGIFITEDGVNKIESAYNACVQFVKWYNKNK